MNIVVCIKRTPASTSVALDSATGTVKTEGVPHAINPFDEYAVEEALRLKEKIAGSKVFVLSAGTPESSEVVRAGLALGADHGVLLTDPAFAGSDFLVTTGILQKAIEKIAGAHGGVHLVLFGKQTNDGESGHVPAGVAARLRWPSAISVRKIPQAGDDEITVERMMDDGIDTLKLKLPAAVGVTKEINEPRLPSLKGKMAAKRAAIETWGAADLGLDAGALGAAASPTEVIKLSPVPTRSSGITIEGETPEDKAKNLVLKLKESKFI